MKMKSAGRYSWLILMGAILSGVLPGRGADTPLNPATRVSNAAVESAAVAMPKIEAGITAVAVSTLIDEQLSSVGQALTHLAALSEVRSLDWPTMKSRLAEEQLRAIPCVLWFARPDGSYFTVDKGLISQSLTDRTYFAVVMSGKPVFGEVVVSKSTGKPAGIITVPITAGGKVVGALGATIYLEQLSERLEKVLKLPPNVFYYALDHKGVIALHSRRELLLVEPLQKGDPALARAISEILERREGVAAYAFEGQRRTVAFCTSPVTGWHFALGVLP